MLPKPAITVECGNFSQFKKQTIMKKSALIAIVLLCPSFSFAQNIVLKMNLENGKTYNQSTTTVLTITQDVMGQPVEIEMTIIGEMSFLVQGVSDDVYDMELQYERLKMEMKMPQMNMAFDTDTPDEQDMMSRLMTSLKNKPFNIKMNSRGKILEVSNSENLYSGMMEQMDGMDEMQKIQLKTQMEDSFGPETLKGNIEMATAMFPEQPVDIGDSWAVETKLESSMSMILKSDYQLLESTKEFNKVKGEGVMSTDDQQGFVETNGMLMKYNMKGTMSSDITLDAKSGWPVEARISQHLAGENEMKVTRDAPDTMKIPMEMNSTIVMTD
jgi:FKBP-type peptidyl-prolyl cis-trans isomerase 2